MEFKEADARERQEWIETGEFIIVPRGVEHRPSPKKNAGSCSSNPRPR